MNPDDIITHQKAHRKAGNELVGYRVKTNFITRNRHVIRRALMTRNPTRLIHILRANRSDPLAVELLDVLGGDASLLMGVLQDSLQEFQPSELK